MNYYVKAVPKLPLQLNSGASIRFENIDHEWGIFATEDPNLIREIDACIAEHKGGVERITAEQYLELKSKKNGSSLKPRWREEFVLGQHVRDRLLRGSPQAAAVAATDHVPLEKPRETDLKDFRPTATK